MWMKRREGLVREKLIRRLLPFIDNKKIKTPTVAMGMTSWELSIRFLGGAQLSGVDPGYDGTIKAKEGMNPKMKGTSRV